MEVHGVMSVFDEDCDWEEAMCLAEEEATKQFFRKRKQIDSEIKAKKATARKRMKKDEIVNTSTKIKPKENANQFRKRKHVEENVNNINLRENFNSTISKHSQEFVCIHTHSFAFSRIRIHSQEFEHIRILKYSARH